MYLMQSGSKKSVNDGFFNSRGDEIRTHDLFVPNEALYQAEPHPDTLLFIISNWEYVESENLLLWLLHEIENTTNNTRNNC